MSEGHSSVPPSRHSFISAGHLPDPDNVQKIVTAVGNSLEGTPVVDVLGTGVVSRIANNLLISAQMKAEVGLGSINFLSNDRLKQQFESMPAAPEQIAEAVHINTDARLQALKTDWFVLACVALMKLVPCGWLPDDCPVEIPEEARPAGEPLKT